MVEHGGTRRHRGRGAVACALLVVRGCDVDDAADRAVRQWCDGVIADSPGYVDGAPWTSPRSWQGERRAPVAQFRACVKPPPPGLSTEMKRGVMCALALKFESILVAPPVGGLEKYLGALLADEKKCLLGAGGGNTTKKGAPRRFTYLMPRVARLVRDDRAALLRLVAEGASAAMDATQAENDDAVAGETRRSAKKPRLKEMLADLSSTVAHLDAALETENKSRKQAVRRAADTRENITAAVARRAERARADATVAASGEIAAMQAKCDAAVAVANVKSEAAIARARAAEDDSRRARAAVKRLRSKQSDPAALRVLTRALEAERREGHFLRADKDKLIAEVRELREQIAGMCTTELFRRQRGKSVGRGPLHGLVLRRLYKELLALNVFPSRANTIIAKVGRVRARARVRGGLSRLRFRTPFQTSLSPRLLAREFYLLSAPRAACHGRHARPR